MDSGMERGVGYVGVVEAMKATCVGIHYVWPG